MESNSVCNLRSDLLIMSMITDRVGRHSVNSKTMIKFEYETVHRLYVS